MRGRLAPSRDPERTGARLLAEPEPQPEPLAQAFLGTVAAATGRRIVLHRPGAATRSFDEAWILRLLDVLRDRDWDSAAFCLGSRIPRPCRATVRRLAAALAERI